MEEGQQRVQHQQDPPQRICLTGKHAAALSQARTRLAAWLRRLSARRRDKSEATTFSPVVLLLLCRLFSAG